MNKFTRQDLVALPPINIDNIILEVFDSFTYPGSTITSNFSLENFIKNILQNIWSSSIEKNQFSPSLPQTHPQHLLLGQGRENGRPGTYFLLFSIHTLLSQWRLRSYDGWRSYTERSPVWSSCRPYLLQKDNCKRDIKMAGIDKQTAGRLPPTVEVTGG